MDPISPKPGSCREIGLNCHQCVTASARQLAAACGAEMSVREIEDIFFSMYDDPACASMSGRFVQICLDPPESTSWLTGAAPAFGY
jgi:hypothetical protein